MYFKKHKNISALKKNYSVTSVFRKVGLKNFSLSIILIQKSKINLEFISAQILGNGI